ncbi:MAG: VanZ family protein [Nitrosomonas sp.]|nr:VanZ family protein [Nitrosomonas sp.]
MSDSRLPDRISPSWALLMLVVGFIIYGSLFPFNFQSPQPFERLYANLNLFQYRSDMIDNFLLFIPLGIALYFSFNRMTQRVVAASLSWILLGVLLQIVQLYLPGRVASLTDSFWNAVGLISGLLVARLSAPWLRHHANKIQQPHDRFALILVMAWLAYESFPFVPTLDIVELRNHTKTFFYAPSFEWMRLWQHSVAAVLGTIAILRAQILQQRWLIMTAAALVLIILEILVPYGDLRRESLLGICIGILVGERLEFILRAQTRIVVIGIALCAYLTTILLPFRGQAADGAFTFTPFALILWFGNTKAVSPTAFEILAIGSLLWAGMFNQPQVMRQTWLWPLSLALILLLLESVRILLMGYHGDTTPLVILITLIPFARSLQRHQSDFPKPGQPASRFTPESTEKKRSPDLSLFSTQPVTKQIKIWSGILLTVVIISLGLWILIQLPGVPYNLRELFGDQRLIGCLVFGVALLWLGAGPYWVAHQAGKRPWPVLWLPLWLIAAACISLLLLQYAVTTESLNDITGSTDLYRRIVQDNIWGNDWQNRLKNWPDSFISALERVVRFTALYWLLLIPLSLCALFGSRLWRSPAITGAFFILLPLWWAAKWVVVDAAITDNLTELIASDGQCYLGALLLLLAVHASLLSRINRRPDIIIMAVIGSALSLALSWWLLNQGLESVLFKYDNVYSGIQFLLGASRTHILAEEELLMRWAVVYFSMTGIIALGMRFAMSVSDNNAA